jgi:hypothetical protein
VRESSSPRGVGAQNKGQVDFSGFQQEIAGFASLGIKPVRAQRELHENYVARGPPPL